MVSRSCSSLLLLVQVKRGDPFLFYASIKSYTFRFVHLAYSVGSFWPHICLPSWTISSLKANTCVLSVYDTEESGEGGRQVCEGERRGWLVSLRGHINFRKRTGFCSANIGRMFWWWKGRTRKDLEGGRGRHRKPNYVAYENERHVLRAGERHRNGRQARWGETD